MASWIAAGWGLVTRKTIMITNLEISVAPPPSSGERLEIELIVARASFKTPPQKEIPEAGVCSTSRLGNRCEPYSPAHLPCAMHLLGLAVHLVGNLFSLIQRVILAHYQARGGRGGNF